MAYIENVVIGTPIVDPKDMFVSDEDDWTRMEEEEIMESVSEKERDETEQEDRTNENSFFERTDDFYAIYQYDNTDGNWGYKFMGLSIISNMGLSVDGKDYRMMFMEQLHEHDSLDELYHRFNAERPEGFDGHSLSVSDVVIMKRNGEMKAYYVDDVGFSELPEFTKQREQIIDRSNDSPVYAGTLEQAVRQKDADAYLDSRKLNIDCKKAIEEAIQENYDGIRLKDDVAKDVVRRFGEERMNFVMANTIRESFLEGRFSKQNKEWAEHINIPENISHGRNLNLDYIIESHPVVLDDFISMARFEIRMLKIERAIEDAEVSITTDTNDYVADGHEGAWHTIEERKYAGKKFFLMEHNEFGSNVAEIIVTENGQLVAEDLWNGFDKGALEAISEYLQDKGISEEEIYKEPDELAYKIHDGYFSIHRTDGGYDYTFYTKDYEDIDGGIYDNPDSPIKQVVEDILEDAGISLDDAEWMDYEELDAEVEHAEEIKQLAVDLDKFSYEYDTYEYKDSIEDREEQIDKLTEDILTRKTDDIKKWLIEVSENSEIDNDVGDLVGGTYSNGSDERDYADQWFERCWFGMFPEPTLLNHLLNLGYEPEHYLDMLENVETIKSDIEITKQNIAEPSDEWKDIVYHKYNDDRTSYECVPCYNSVDEYIASEKEDLESYKADLEEALEELKDMIADWKPEKEPNMDEEIELIKKWVKEREDFINE